MISANHYYWHDRRNKARISTIKSSNNEHVPFSLKSGRAWLSYTRYTPIQLTQFQLETNWSCVLSFIGWSYKFMITNLADW